MIDAYAQIGCVVIYPILEKEEGKKINQKKIIIK